MEAIFELRGLWYFVMIATVFYLGMLMGIKRVSDRLFLLKNLDKDSVPEFINNLIEEAQNKIDIYALFALALLVFSLWVLFF